MTADVCLKRLEEWAPLYADEGSQNIVEAIRLLFELQARQIAELQKATEQGWHRYTYAATAELPLKEGI